MDKKAQIQALAPIIVSLVGVGIVLTIGFLIIAEAYDAAESVEGTDYSNATLCAASVTCNGTNAVRSAMEDIPGWLPIIVITIIGSILLGLVAYFKAR